MDPLADDVRRELQALGPNAAIGETTEAWPAAVGAEIARNAWPARFQRDGVLIVHAADAVWAFELTQRADEIAGRLGTLVPKGMRFVPGPLPEPSSEVSQGDRTVVRAATLSEAQRAAEWAAVLEDPELRELVARAARASLARAASDRRF